MPRIAELTRASGSLIVPGWTGETKCLSLLPWSQDMVIRCHNTAEKGVFLRPWVTVSLVRCKGAAVVCKNHQGGSVAGAGVSANSVEVEALPFQRGSLSSAVDENGKRNSRSLHCAALGPG
jgi:hypothetical protein